MAQLTDLVPGEQEDVWGQILEDNIVAINTEVEACVHRAGAETITGVKTFAAKPVVPDSTFTVAKLDATGTRNNTTFLRGDGTFAVPPGSGSTVSANTLGTLNNPVTDPAAPRPTGLTRVVWDCPTDPTNWANGDFNLQKGS